MIIESFRENSKNFIQQTINIESTIMHKQNQKKLLIADKNYHNNYSETSRKELPY